MSGLAFVDTETTGLDPDRHEIWEVALILEAGSNMDGEFIWQLPVDLGRADPFALKVGHFWERRGDAVLSYVTQFAESFAELTRGCHMVGAVPSFDDERLRKLLRANGACPEWHYHLIDVEALAVGYLSGLRTVVTEYGIPTERATWTSPEERDDCYGAAVMRSAAALDGLPWRSDELSRACGVEPPSDDERHTALGDARWAKRLYDAIVGQRSVIER